MKYSGRLLFSLIALYAMLGNEMAWASANLISNGGFEYPVNAQDVVFYYPDSQGLTSWIINGDRADILLLPGRAHAGVQFLQFSRNTPAVWQRMGTTPGVSYCLTWWQSSNSVAAGGVNVSWRNGATGAVIQSMTASETTWTRHSLIVVAQTSTDYVVISRSGIGYPWIDDVEVDECDSQAYPVVDAKRQEDGDPVVITGIVSATFSDSFYVESSDRSSGIRAAMSDDGVAVGDQVVVTGTTSTADTQERCVLAETVALSGKTEEILPLAISNRALGGSDWEHTAGGTVGQRGVAGGVGLNNIGLLVRITGRVSSVGTDCFYIDDGSGCQDSSGNKGVRVSGEGINFPRLNDYACVTGISTCFGDAGACYRALRMRSQQDLMINGQSSGKSILISSESASVGMGRTLKISAVATEMPSVPLVGTQLWPYVDGRQWGSPEVTDSQGRADFLIPLPNSGTASIQVKDGSPVPFYELPVGQPSPPNLLSSNTLSVQVENRAVEMPTDPDRLVAMEYEPWQIMPNFNFQWWKTAESVPLIGYYNSFDPDVVRQHAIWMAEAGVNFVMVDWVYFILGKQHWYERDAYIDDLVDCTTKMLDVFAQMRSEGIPVPKVVLMPGLDNGAPTTTTAINEALDWIQTNYVSNPRYEGLWLECEGKPLVIVFNGGGPANLAGQPPIDGTHFTIRYMSHQLQARDPNAYAGYWSWMDGVVHPIPVCKADATPDAYWIWNSTTADNQTVYFRKTFTLDAPPERASLTITCDDSFDAYVNGRHVSTGSSWPLVQTADGLEQYLVPGTNVIAVRASNGLSPAGLIAKLETASGQAITDYATDASWRVFTQQPAGWPGNGADPGSAATVLAPLGQGVWGVLPAWSRPVEALTVTPACFSGNGWLGADAAGRRGGTTYIEEFKSALQYRPKHLILNQWNEFAGQYEGSGSFYGDSYNIELSADMEPTSLTACAYRGCGGWGLYYLNLSRALVNMYRQDIPEDTVLAVASPVRDSIVTSDSVQVDWNAIGAPVTSYTILLDDQPMALGVQTSPFTLSLGGVTNGLHKLTLKAEGTSTHYRLARDREDDRLATPIPVIVDVDFTLQRP